MFQSFFFGEKQKNFQEMFPEVIAQLIVTFLTDFELLEWIDITRLNWATLCDNPFAIQLLEHNFHRIH